MMGEYELPEGYKPKIEVIVNPEEKTMKFIDNGGIYYESVIYGSSIFSCFRYCDR